MSGLVVVSLQDTLSQVFTSLRSPLGLGRGSPVGCFCGALLVLSAPGAAAAQDIPERPEGVDEASSGPDTNEEGLDEASVRAQHESLFFEAREALAAQQSARAERLLRRALSLRPDHGPTVYLLILTLRDTGHAVEALELIEAILAGRYGDVPEQFHAEAEQHRDELARTVAHLRLTLEGAQRATVRLDGSRRASLALGEALKLRIDPGIHVLEVSAEGYARVERSVRAQPGEAIRMPIVLRPVAAETLVRDEPRPFIRRPAFWWVVAAVLVAGAAGIVTWRVLREDGSSLRPQAPFDSIVYTQRSAASLPRF